MVLADTVLHNDHGGQLHISADISYHQDGTEPDREFESLSSVSFLSSPNEYWIFHNSLFPYKGCLTGEYSGKTGNGAVYRIPVNKQILRVPIGIDINPIPFEWISDPDYRQSLLP